MCSTNKGKGKGEEKPAVKATDLDADVVNERTSNFCDTYKSFCIRFIYLNGILFTRTRYLTINASFLGRFLFDSLYL